MQYLWTAIHGFIQVQYTLIHLHAKQKFCVLKIAGRHKIFYILKPEATHNIPNTNKLEYLYTCT